MREYTFRLEHFSMHQNQSAVFWLPANTTWRWAWRPKIFKTPQHLALNGELRTVKSGCLICCLCGREILKKPGSKLARDNRFRPWALYDVLQSWAQYGLSLSYLAGKLSASHHSTLQKYILNPLSLLLCFISPSYIWDWAMNAWVTFCFKRVMSSCTE